MLGKINAAHYKLGKINAAHYTLGKINAAHYVFGKINVAQSLEKSMQRPQEKMQICSNV